MILDDALLLAQFARVFPVAALKADLTCSCYLGDKCPPKNWGKHPDGKLVGSEKNGRGRFKVATQDPEQIRKWFDVSNPPNVGWLPGPGRIVIDVDGPEGTATLRDLQATHGALPGAPFTVSGRPEGGYHMLFACEPGVFLSKAGFLHKLDARVEDNGHLVGPGSMHKSGNRYTWGSDPAEFLDPPPLPDWLGALIPRVDGANAAPAIPVSVEPVDVSVIHEALTQIRNTHRNVEYRDIARNVLEGAPFALPGQGADDKMNGFAGVIVGKLPVTVPLTGIVEVCRRSLGAMGAMEGGQGAEKECAKFLEKLERARVRVEAKRQQAKEERAYCEKATNEFRKRMGLIKVESPAELPTRHSMLVQGLPVMAYVSPWNRYVPIRFAPLPRWVVENSMVKEAAIAELRGDVEIAKEAHPDRPDFWDLRTTPNHPLIVPVDGVQRVPDGAFTCDVDGCRVLNVWAPPTVRPVEGSCENIVRLLKYLTGDNDPEAVEWLLDMLAAKYQNPGSTMPCAPLFHGPQGTGKTSLFRIVSELWGPQNVALVDQATLESDFNATHADKLWVLADDCFPAGSKRDMASVLKTLITGDTVMVNEKGIRRYSQKNRRAIMFAANRLDALLIETGDRRVSIFSSPDVFTDAWRTFVMGFWVRGKQNTPADGFWKEMAGFAFMLRNRVVGVRHILPHKNEPRERVIAASMTSVQAFAAEADAVGFEAVAEGLGGAAVIQSDPEKRRGVTGGYRAAYVFDVYVRWCERMNMRPVYGTSFGLAVSQNWEKRRDTAGVLYEIPETKTAGAH